MRGTGHRVVAWATVSGRPFVEVLAPERVGSCWSDAADLFVVEVVLLVDVAGVPFGGVAGACCSHVGGDALEAVLCEFDRSVPAVDVDDGCSWWAGAVGVEGDVVGGDVFGGHGAALRMMRFQRRRSRSGRVAMVVIAAAASAAVVMPVAAAMRSVMLVMLLYRSWCRRP